MEAAVRTPHRTGRLVVPIRQKQRSDPCNPVGDIGRPAGGERDDSWHKRHFMAQIRDVLSGMRNLYCVSRIGMRQVREHTASSDGQRIEEILSSR
jgi:hypothetical protein